jgi:hypothetical protein
MTDDKKGEPRKTRPIDSRLRRTQKRTMADGRRTQKIQLIVRVEVAIASKSEQKTLGHSSLER